MESSKYKVQCALTLKKDAHLFMDGHQQNIAAFENRFRPASFDTALFVLKSARDECDSAPLERLKVVLESEFQLRTRLQNGTQNTASSIRQYEKQVSRKHHRNHQVQDQTSSRKRPRKRIRRK
uniref:Uncharacterized protein n=1 Tax=Timspurckia oligopyrenoides TaxID=708627 RepID=A0A7S0ZJQ7_9RHOD